MEKISKIVVIGVISYIVISLLLLIICLKIGKTSFEPKGNWVEEGDRMVLKDWAIFYSKDGTTHSPSPGDYFQSLEDCQATAEKQHPNTDYFCGTDCIFVWDGMRLEHCKKRLKMICSEGECHNDKAE